MDAFPPKGVASEYSQMLFMHIPDTFEAQSCFLTGGWGPVMNCNMKVTDRKMNEILKIHLLFGHLILNTFTFLYLKTYIYIYWKFLCWPGHNPLTFINHLRRCPRTLAVDTWILLVAGWSPCGGFCQCMLHNLGWNRSLRVLLCSWSHYWAVFRNILSIKLLWSGDFAFSLLSHGDRQALPWTPPTGFPLVGGDTCSSFVHHSPVLKDQLKLVVESGCGNQCLLWWLKDPCVSLCLSATCCVTWRTLPVQIASQILSWFSPAERAVVNSLTSRHSPVCPPSTVFFLENSWPVSLLAASKAK